MTASLIGIQPSRRKFALPLENGDHLDQPTFHERYLAMPENFRAQLIGGKVYVSSPLRADHGDMHGLVMMWMNLYRTRTPGTRAMDNATAILGQDSEPQPDASLVIVGGRTRINKKGYLTGPPELLVEVAMSSAAYDLFEKKKDYEKYGVGEYLVLSLDNMRALWFARAGGKQKGVFVELAASSDGILRSKIFPGLWLDAGALFSGDTKRLVDVLDIGLASPEHAAFAAKLKK